MKFPIELLAREAVTLAALIRRERQQLLAQEAADASGHQHKGEGPGGGQFTGNGSGGSGEHISGQPTETHRADAERYAASAVDVPTETAKVYAEHLAHALAVLLAGIGKETATALKHGGVKFHADLKALRAEAERLACKKASGVVGFAHDRGMGTDVHLDGGDDPRGTYVHELWHAADNGGFHSNDKGWQTAYKKDILKGKHLLSRYAMTNASEGFAEFGRALAERGADYMTAHFPTAMKHLKAKGLV